MKHIKYMKLFQIIRKKTLNSFHLFDTTNKNLKYFGCSALTPFFPDTFA